MADREGILGFDGPGAVMLGEADFGHARLAGGAESRRVLIDLGPIFSLVF